MKRRTFLLGLAVVPFAGRAAQPVDMKDIKRMQSDWKTLLAPGTTVPSPSEALKLSKDEWRKRLPPQAYGVLREENTERPGTSPLNHEKRPGVFVCAGCGLPLFTSEIKFESGTGWPSFFTAIPGAFETKRTPTLSARGTTGALRAHGHLFDDGPPDQPALVQQQRLPAVYPARLVRASKSSG
jgi:peptide-methionine (R)-S-oxide reductase